MFVFQFFKMTSVIVSASLYLHLFLVSFESEGGYASLNFIIASSNRCIQWCILNLFLSSSDDSTNTLRPHCYFHRDWVRPVTHQAKGSVYLFLFTILAINETHNWRTTCLISFPDFLKDYYHDISLMEDISAWTFLYRNQMFFKLQILKKKIKIICNIFFFLLF